MLQNDRKQRGQHTNTMKAWENNSHHKRNGLQVQFSDFIAENIDLEPMFYWAFGIFAAPTKADSAKKCELWAWN